MIQDTLENEITELMRQNLVPKVQRIADLSPIGLDNLAQYKSIFIKQLKNISKYEILKHDEEMLKERTQFLTWNYTNLVNELEQIHVNYKTVMENVKPMEVNKVLRDKFKENSNSKMRLRYAPIKDLKSTLDKINKIHRCSPEFDFMHEKIRNIVRYSVIFDIPEEAEHYIKWMGSNLPGQKNWELFEVKNQFNEFV